MLRIENLTKSFGVDALFKDVSFMLGNKQKVALVGANGSGKSTMFKILAGVEEYDSGIIDPGLEKIGYLPQEVELPDDMLVGEFIETLVDDPYSEKYLAENILSRLQFDVDEYTEVGILSPGQRMKLKLTELILQGNTVLLLDEPTNHLDIEGIRWLEKFIHSLDQICIIISHDRAFLNNVCTNVFEIEEEQVHVYTGNYDAYILGKAARLDKRAKEYKAQERKRSQMEKLLASAKKIGDGKARGRAVGAAKKRMIREVTRHEIDEYSEKKIGGITIDGAVREQRLLLRVEDLEFSYTDEPLIKDLSFEIRGKERLWISGPNGVGKTTLINLLTGALTPQKGMVEWTDGVRWTYFSQNQEHLEMDMKLQDYFLKYTDVDYGKSFGVLSKYLFTREMMNRKLRMLSPGQRARLSFAVFTQNEYELLILDEPTNHLDIDTKEAIEEAINEYKGAVILISHDRYFVENVGVTSELVLS